MKDTRLVLSKFPGSKSFDEIDMWANDKSTRHVLEKVGIAVSAAHIALLQACMKSSDPEVRDAFSQYDALMAVAELIENPRNK